MGAPTVVVTGRWAGYAAAACAFVFAGVSFYWGSGGTFGLDTVGGEAVRLSREGGTVVYVVLWLTGLLKVTGGVLAIALVQQWGIRLLRRRALLVLGWTCAALLTLYGGLLVAGGLLVEFGAITTPRDMDWRGLHGHLFLWDPWFLVWGLLLGMTAYRCTPVTARTERRRETADRTAGSCRGIQS